MQRALAVVPEDHRDRYMIMGLLGAVVLVHGERSGDRAVADEGLSLLVQAADEVGEDSMYRGPLNDLAALSQARRGHAAQDLGLINDAIRRFSVPRGRTGVLPGERARRAVMLAMLIEDRYRTVAQIMTQAQGRSPQVAGYMAVLSACASDLASADHDEALTLASALMAAGAWGVVGTRWPTADLAAAELMMAFHHFLNREGQRPADALRAAQLWMLGQNRPALEDLSSIR